MPKKLKCAILGAGNVASHHVKAWQQLGQVEVVGIYRRNEEKAKQFADEHRLSWTTDYKEFLNDPQIDMVDIVLPSGLHSQFGQEAARAGKHVIVEKPIDVTLDKADQLIKTCEQHNVTLGTVSQYRFMTGMQQMYEVLRQGKLGKLVQGDAYIKWYRPQDYYESGAWRGTWQLDGGGPFMNQGIHFIDLLLSAMGPVKSVYAKTKTIAHSIEVEDIGVALLEFRNGALGVIEASTSSFPGLPAKLDIHGTDGTLSIEGDKLVFMHTKNEEPYHASDVDSGGASKPMDIDVTPFVRQFQDIVTAIHKGSQPTVNGYEARKPLELILAIYQSARKGKTIVLNGQ